MRNFSVMYKTVESVLDWYDEQDYHCFRAGMGTTGKNIETGYYGDDTDAAAQKLVSYLQRIDNAENDSQFRLETGTCKGGKFTPYHSIIFQLHERDKQPQPMNGAPNYYFDLIAKMNALEQRLAMKEAEEAEEEEEEEEEETGIGSILNSPQMKNVLINVLANMITPKQPAALAGVPENSDKENLLIEALEILKKNDPELETDLYKLATISETNPDFFKMLLSMLRKQ